MTEPKDNGITSYALGQPYWPSSDGPSSRYNCRYGHHELVLYHTPIDQAIIQAFNNAAIRFAAWPDPPVLWLLYHIAGYSWADAPFTIHNVDPEERINDPLPTPETRYTITLLLVDADTSLIRAIRMATIPPTTSRIIHDEIERQLQTPFDDQTFQHHVTRTYREHPYPESMTEHASLTETLGQ